MGLKDLISMCPFTDKWINKAHGSYTQRNITRAGKRDEILPSAVTWMGLEGIVLGEISQSQKRKYDTVSLTYGI